MNLTLAGINLSNSELETIVLILGIVALALWILGARPWRRG